MPTDKKVARFLWKTFGSDATETVLSSVGVPGAGVIVKLLEGLTGAD
jgi:hypothetical protein